MVQGATQRRGVGGGGNQENTEIASKRNRNSSKSDKALKSSFVRTVIVRSVTKFLVHLAHSQDALREGQNYSSAHVKTVQHTDR